MKGHHRRTDPCHPAPEISGLALAVSGNGQLQEGFIDMEHLTLHNQFHHPIMLLGVFPAEQSLLWWTVFLTGAGVNFGIGLSLGILTVMLADVVDYGEFKLGSRNESILFSTQTFVVKLAGALSGFITGAGLSLIGFVANQVQSPGTVAGLRVIMGGIPMAFSIVYLLVFWKFYRLDAAFLRKIRETLAQRKA